MAFKYNSLKINQNRIPEHIAQSARAKNEIKKLLVQIHQHIKSDQRLESMQAILAIGEKYICYPDVERSFCHAISNVSMKSDFAKTLIVLQAHKQVSMVLEKYIGIDWKVCWLGCSALWNLARPAETRDAFTIEIINLVLKCVNYHEDQHKLVNTALGALSNLSLSDSLKTYVGQQSNLRSVLQALQIHFQDHHVACTGCGLIANLAVDDDIANRLVNLNCINIVTRIADLHYKIFVQENQINFRKNVVASISNMSTANHYSRNCVENEAIELLYQCLEDFQDNQELTTLIHSALDALNLPNTGYSTSLHAACYNGWKKVAQKIINRRGDAGMYEQDVDFLYPIDLAAQFRFYDIVEYLIANGSPHPQKVESIWVQSAIHKGMQQLNKKKYEYAKVISNACLIHIDAALVIVNYLPPFMLFRDGNWIDTT